MKTQEELQQEREWEERREAIIAEMEQKIVPLRPGDWLEFEPYNATALDPDKFQVAEVAPSSPNDGRFKLIGTDITHSAWGQRALVIQHVPWRTVHFYNRLLDKCNDWERIAEGLEEYLDPYVATPQMETYLVLCGDRLVYARRYHQTEEQVRDSKELMERFAVNSPR